MVQGQSGKSQAGNRAQRLRACTALPEDPAAMPGTSQLTAYNSNYRGSNTFLASAAPALK